MNNKMVKILVRIAVSLILFVIAGLYVYGIQLKYDKEKSELTKTITYLFLILGAGLTYDCLKAAIFLEEAKIFSFARSLAKSIISFAAVIACAAVTAIFINKGILWGGAIMYAVLMAHMWHLVVDTTDTVTIFRSQENNLYERTH
jgi:uncharacterized membrane protein